MRLSDCHNIDDFRLLAKQRLPWPVFDYIDGAAYGEVTLRRNVEDFASLPLRQQSRETELIRMADGLRQELATERQRQEAAAAALARAEVRLEAVPGLQTEIERLRAALEADQKARQQAEQSAAVLAARLEAAERRATSAEARSEKAEQEAIKAAKASA